MKNFLKLSLSVFLLSVCQLVSAQDDLIREERKVSGFNAVKATGIASVYLQKGDQEKVIVEVNDKVINERLKINVVANELHIRLEKADKWENTKKDLKLKVYITYKTLHRLEGSGATSFSADDEIKADDFKLELSGANNSKLNINAVNLEVETSGAANATLSGEADKVTINSSGASNVKAYDLKAESVSAESSGVSNVFVTVQDKLEVKASGLSNINYKGNAKVITREVSKMSHVKKQ